MYCFKCMNMKEGHICEKCGFDPSTYIYKSFVLQEGTFLKNGRYMLGYMIGNGGFGITYVGYDNYTNTKVCVKEYFPSVVARRNVEESNDVHVDDAYLIKYKKGVDKYVYDFFYENSTEYMVMEYIEGEEIDKIVGEHGPLGLSETINIYYQVLTALKAIHDKGILHRDISPKNIILQNNRVPRLIDFGASRFYSTEMSLDLTVMLTHGYAPLEQYLQNGNHGPWEDIYAVSASMYYTLTGVLPVSALDRQGVEGLKPIRAYNKDVPYEIEKIIFKGLALKVEDRYKNVQDMLSDIDMYLRTAGNAGSYAVSGVSRYGGGYDPDISSGIPRGSTYPAENIGYSSQIISQKQTKRLGKEEIIIGVLAGVFVILFSVIFVVVFG